jgi:arsenite methyltransferase
MEDNTVDVITSNGVLNPVTDKQVAFSKLFRVMEPGGKKQISDIITQRCEEELVEAKNSPKLWAECIVGAFYENYYNRWLEEASFENAEVIKHQDYLSHSDNESMRDDAQHFNAESITIIGNKPC